VASRGTLGAGLIVVQWGMTEPRPGPDPMLDPDQPVPDDAAELLPDATQALPPPPIEATPEDPGGDPTGVPEPA
jgi:hypothetical protein